VDGGARALPIFPENGNMSTPHLPIALASAAALLIFTLGVYLVAVHTFLATLAAARSTLGPSARSRAPLVVGAFLSAWVGLALLTGDAANFPLAGDELRLLLLLAVAFGPMLLAIALLFGTSTMRAIGAATPPEWLIRAQVYRVAGVIFLFPFLYYGVIPAGFAVPAVIGDVATGLAAPFVASQIERRRGGALALAVGWNLFGIADLIVAPTAAVLSRAPLANLFPLVVVPLFLGPPLGILTHVYSLKILANLSGAGPASDGPKLARPIAVS
jgi:hypothetical protein